MSIPDIDDFDDALEGWLEAEARAVTG